MIVRKAKNEDLLVMQKLFAKAGIRDDDLVEHLQHFLVIINEENETVGTVGIEKYGRDGLLRSFVIDTNALQASMSLQFLEVALQYAREHEMTSLYLCTKGKSMLFQQLGFREITIADVPKKVQSSAHFQRQLQNEHKIWTCEC